MTLTAAKFAQGMTTDQYIASIKVNKEPFRQIHAAAAVPAETLDYFNGLGQPLNLAVFTADWCGDAMSTTPAILRLADATDNLRLSVFNRDDELDLTNSFLPVHRAGTVPVFVVLDAAMGEVARFVETARALVPAIDAMDELAAQAAAQVAADAGAGAVADNDGARRRAMRGHRTAHRVSQAAAWSAVILDEFRQTVAAGLALPPGQRPAESGTEWPPQE